MTVLEQRRRKTAGEFISEIDRRVAAKALLSHPFYKAWVRGELTREALRDYAVQYGRHVAAFPTYLSALHARTEDAATRRHILANLMDEEAGTPNHPEMWLDFAEAVGANRAEIADAKPWPETERLIETFRAICRERSTAEGLASLYAYESQIPAVSESKIDGLKKFYGIDSDAGLRYFRVHIEADREHSAVERCLLEQQITENDFRAVERSVDDVLQALWEMLSGVCRRHALQ